MEVLDDKNYVTQRDPQNALGFAASQPQGLQHDFGIADANFARRIDNVVFAGMGGSALAAECLYTWPNLAVPLIIAKEYNLPQFVGKNTLVMCASYSGNTEETSSALQQAEVRGAHIAVISRGGQLAQRAKAQGYVFAKLPETDQPRTGTLAIFRAVIEILVAAKLADQDSITTLEKTAKSLQAATAGWLQSVPAADNLAKQLAGHMVGKTLITYAGPLMYPAAYKWKLGANENAKNTAWCNMLPECNHNEFTGWTGHPVEKPFAVFDLISHFEHPQVLRRFEVTDRLLSGMRPKSIPVVAEGNTPLEHLLYLVLLGDFATIYLAVLNGTNPVPLDLVDKFKKELT